MPRPAPACIVIAPTVTDHIMQVASDSQSLFDHGGPHHRLDPVRAAEDQHTREHRKHQQHRVGRRHVGRTDTAHRNRHHHDHEQPNNSTPDRRPIPRRRITRHPNRERTGRPDGGRIRPVMRSLLQSAVLDGRIVRHPTLHRSHAGRRIYSFQGAVSPNFS
jgi:hypothetical protein